MWIKESCYIVPLPLWIDTANLEDIVIRMDSYINYLFYLSKKTDVYLLLEPTPITIKMRNIKRLIMFPVFSSIVCNSLEINLAKRFYKVEEGTWVRVGIVTPYATSISCINPRAQNLGLAINPSKGIPYVCTDKLHIDTELGLKILRGGFIEVNHSKRNLGRKITITVSRDPLTILFKNVLDVLKTYVENMNEVEYSPIDIDKSLNMYANTIMMIDEKPTIIKIGKGIIFTLDLSNSIAKILYDLAILAIFNTTINQ